MQAILILAHRVKLANMELKIKSLSLYMGCFTGVAVLLIILFKILGLAPFGGSTLASADVYYQYMDFYAWFHDVLHGSNNIGQR